MTTAMPCPDRLEAGFLGKALGALPRFGAALGPTRARNRSQGVTFVFAPQFLSRENSIGRADAQRVRSRWRTASFSTEDQ